MVVYSPETARKENRNKAKVGCLRIAAEIQSRPQITIIGDMKGGWQLDRPDGRLGGIAPVAVGVAKEVQKPLKDLGSGSGATFPIYGRSDRLVRPPPRGD